MTNDLSELKRLAEAAIKTDGMEEWEEYRLESGPRTIISLIVWVEEAEAQARELKGEIVKLLKRNTELKAQRKKLQEVLRPFAKEAKYWPTAPGTTLAYGEVTVGDFRAARTALGDTNG
jgi:hypothetical protein